MKNNSIYIHIPFCESKCSYCRFASFGGMQKFEIAKYVDFLCRDIIKRSESFLDTSNNNVITTIYFGGGTPSTLTKDQIIKILTTLKSKFIFTEDIEISFESTPGNISHENLSHWIDIGINRLSFGVQSLNKQTLQEIDRTNKGNILEKLDILQAYFLQYKNKNISISLDFIIGLPYVKTSGVVEDLKYICETYKFVDHISVYMLEEYYEKAENLTEQKNKFDNITYPTSWDKIGISEDEYLTEYVGVQTYLESVGFNRYEISNYSKLGKECKHNQAYWERGNIIAFGLSASGYFNNIRYTNSASFKNYYLGEDIFYENLENQDTFIEDVMFALRTSGIGEDLAKQCNNDKIKFFINEGLLYKHNSIIKLSCRGVLLLDYILAEII